MSKKQVFAFVTNLGVFLGLILLAYEMRQNSELMRAQITMQRAVTNMQILTDVANGGALLAIDARLHEEVAGFPQAIGWSSRLTAEEQRRYQFWMFVRLVELNNDWYQCASGLMSEHTCQNDVRENMRQSLHRFHETGVSFSRSEAGFVLEMQALARQENLPAIDDQGSWQ